MNMYKTLLAAALAAGSPLLHAAYPHPIVQTYYPNLVIKAAGQMRVQLEIPFVSDVDLTTPVTQGRIELQPIQYVPGLLGHFSLNHFSLRFADFDIDRGYPVGLHRFRQVGVHLRDAVEIVAVETAPSVYAFTLLKDDLTFYSAMLENGDMESGRKHPSQDVTGTLNLLQRTFTAKVVVDQDVSFGWGDVDGVLTITIHGIVGPISDIDMDGVLDPDDSCMLTANAPVRTDLGQLEQPPVVSPVVTPPRDVRSPSCANVHIGEGLALDVCDGLWTTLTNDARDTFGVGTTTVTWTASTIADRVGTATQTVTVVDQTPPQFTSVPPALTFSSCRPVSIGVATASDDCGEREVVITNNAPARFPVGRTIVTWVATDRAGNRATASQAVTVTSCSLFP